jgi:hypothetical protein
MSAQRGQPTADVAKTFSPDNRAKECLLCKRSRLLRPLAALIAAAAVIIWTGAFEPSLLPANPPHVPHPHPGGMPSPHQMPQHLQEQFRKEQQMLQEWLGQQRVYHENLQRLRAEHEKRQRQRMMEQALRNGAKPGSIPHIIPPAAPPHVKPGQALPIRPAAVPHLKPGPAAQPKPGPGSHPNEGLAKHPKPGPISYGHPGTASQGNPGTNPQQPVITAKQFPPRTQACGDLVQALRHMHAADEFHAESREMALGSIRETLRRFGETPTLAAPIQKKDHLRWAETYLRSAHKRMFELWYRGNPRWLPPELWVPVLAEIHRALFFLDHPGLPFPNLEQARHELVEAMHLVHGAEKLHVRSKERAFVNVRKALYVLGEVPPAPSAPDPKADHIRLAEGHLRRAYKDVLAARLLPPEMRAPVLWEIYYAMFVLTNLNPAIPFPSMNEITDELVWAWQELLSVPGMSIELQELALTSIGEAIIVLGHTLPGRWALRKEGDHFKLAGEHLRKAQEHVESKQHLPQELRERLLKEINRATVVHRHTATHGGGVAAPKGR